MKYLQNGKIVTGGKVICGCDIGVENGKITGLFKHSRQKNAVDLGGSFISAGWIDIHCHGGAGYEFAEATDEAVMNACKIHYEHGTRVIYPTVSSSNTKDIVAALEKLRELKEKTPLVIPGVHLEGPYFNPEMCGGQPKGAIRNPDKREYVPILEEYSDIIARWSYAPEADKNNEFLRALNKYGVKSAVGHSAAVLEDVERAYNEGNTLITHLYSCTSTVTRVGGFRKLGIIEAAYLLDGMYAEAISDGAHLPKELLRLIVKLKGTDRVALITDAIKYGGINEEGREVLDCAVPFVVEDGVAKLLDRSAFAGSIATCDRLYRFALSCGFGICDTVKMMTETPAAIMGLREYGKIEPGFNAVFTVFDNKGNVLNMGE